MRNRTRIIYFCIAVAVSLIGSAISSEIGGRYGREPTVMVSTWIILSCVCIDYLIREFKNK